MNWLGRRLDYYYRIFNAYAAGGKSQLAFWHDAPSINPDFIPGVIGEYYMPFQQKSDYAGPFDAKGIPFLDYRGVLGKQYNPIAIAQYGLGNQVAFARSGDSERRRRFLLIADWLAENLEPNPQGLWMWMHHFDGEYREVLKAPWYSGLAQGQGISLLARAYVHTKNEKYLQAAKKAFESFKVQVKDGGVNFRDAEGYTWFEEYIVSPPPTHILNGFMWGAWGVYDYSILTGDEDAKRLWNEAVETIASKLPEFDIGFWSLYEQSGTLLPMIASRFYHSLHIVQLQVMHRLTGRAAFALCADRWQRLADNRWNRYRALLYKIAFKLCYY